MDYSPAREVRRWRCSRVHLWRPAVAANEKTSDGRAHLCSGESRRQAIRGPAAAGLASAPVTSFCRCGATAHVLRDGFEREGVAGSGRNIN
jgi:hypothetical protein